MNEDLYSGLGSRGCGSRWGLMAVSQTWGGPGPAVTPGPCVTLVFQPPLGLISPKRMRVLCEALKPPSTLLQGSLFWDVKEAGMGQSPGRS